MESVRLGKAAQLPLQVLLQKTQIPTPVLLLQGQQAVWLIPAEEIHTQTTQVERRVEPLGRYRILEIPIRVSAPQGVLQLPAEMRLITAELRDLPLVVQADLRLAPVEIG